MAKKTELVETYKPKVKKCPAKILEKVLKVDPKAKKTTNLEDAWVLLATEYNMEGSIERKLKKEFESEDGYTRFVLYKDGDAVNEFVWEKNDWDKKEMDWNWSMIYKDVLEYCLKHRMFTKAKRKVKPKVKVKDEEE
jgi:hypothetical protein